MSTKPSQSQVEAEALKSEVEIVLENEEELLHPFTEQDESMPASYGGGEALAGPTMHSSKRRKTSLRALWKVPLITRRFLLQDPLVPTPNTPAVRDKAALRALWKIPLILRRFMLRKPFRTSDAYTNSVEDDADCYGPLMPYMRDRVTLRALWKMPLIIRRFLLPKPVLLEEFTTPHRNKTNLRVLWKVPLIVRRFLRAQKAELTPPLSPPPTPSVPPLDAVIPNDPRVVVGRLPGNGLTYYVARNDRPAGQCFFRLVVKAGSLNEDDDQRGVAHLVEHVAFTETAHFPESDGGVARFLAAAGLTAGADHNAFTFYGSTAYQLFGVPSDNAALLDAALLLLADIIGGRALFRDATIDSERAVVLEELRLRTANYGKRLSDFKYSVQFPNSLHVMRGVGGDTAVLSHVSYARVREYYHKWYRTDLAAVIVIGDVEEREIIDKIVRIFGDIPPPRPLPKATVGDPSGGTGPPRPHLPVSPMSTRIDRFHMHYDDEAVTPLFLVAVVEPKPAALIRRDTALALREALLNRLVELAFNQRMLTISQSDHRQSTSAIFNCVMCGVGLPSSVGGDFFETTYYVFPKMGRRSTRLQAFREFLEEHAKFYRFGLGHDELDKVRGIFVVGLRESSRKTELSGDMVDDCQSHFQNGDPFAEETTLCEWSLALLMSFSVEEVNAFIRERRSLKHALVIVSSQPPRMPSASTAPATDDQSDFDEVTAAELAAVWDEVDSDTTITSEWLDTAPAAEQRPERSDGTAAVTVVSHAGSLSAHTGLVDPSQLPPQGAVVERNVLTAPTLGTYTRIVLSNGVVVKLKHSMRKPGKIVINMVAKGGIGILAARTNVDTEEYERTIISGRRADSIYNESGVGGVDLVDMMNILHRTTVNFEANAAINHRYITATCSAGATGPGHVYTDFELLWQLVYLFFTRHELSTGAFERALQHNLAAISIGNKDPTTPFYDRLCELLYGDHALFRRVRSAREERALVSESAAVAFWAECFSNIAEFDISIAGDFGEQAAVEAMLCRYLGVLPTVSPQLPTTRPLFVSAMLPQRVAGPVCERVICMLQRGAPAKIEIVFAVDGEGIGWVEFLAVDLLCIVVRDALEEVLRTRLGATYAVVVGCNAPLYPSLSLLHVFIRFECAALQCDSAIEAVLAELARLRTSTITEEVMTGLRETVRLRRDRLLAEDDHHWRAVMVTCCDLDMSIEDVLRCEERLLVFSAEELTMLLRRCLAEHNSVVLVMLPHEAVQ